MKRDPKLCSNLEEQIQQYVDKGYARKLSNVEIETINEKTWYLPVFPVIHPHKSKIRLVWDAAAKSHGVSLNSVLLKGPDMFNSLQGSLYKLRERAVGISADIQEMFHQIKIRLEDESSQRFLWPSKEGENIENYVMQVLTFGATCSPSSAQFVKNKNAMEYIESYPKAFNSILHCHYVDDYLNSYDTAEQTLEIAKQIRNIHSHDGFNLRNWISNSQDVQNSLNKIESESNTNQDYS